MDEIEGLFDALSKFYGSNRPNVKPIRSYHRAMIERLKRIGK